MGIFDIFSTSFLFSIAIILLICGGIFTYFSYKIDKQDHKLTSMVNLVSILAEDLQFVKNQLNKNVDKNVSKIQMIDKVNSDLISVSDVEDDVEDDDEDDDEDDEDDDEDDDEEEDDTENNTYPLHAEELMTYSFKNLSTNETSIKENNNGLDEIKTIHLENPISFEETNISLSNDKHNDLNNNDMSFLKNVTMPDFENAENVEDLQGSYKKMPINKLREVIVSKGVVSDASKLKKNEILKMLELD